VAWLSCSRLITPATDLPSRWDRHRSQRAASFALARKLWKDSRQRPDIAEHWFNIEAHNAPVLHPTSSQQSPCGNYYRTRPGRDRGTQYLQIRSAISICTREQARDQLVYGARRVVALGRLSAGQIAWFSASRPSSLAFRFVLEILLVFFPAKTLPSDFRPFSYSQPDRLKADHSPLHTTAIAQRTTQ
jgi:hypothetical protein